MPIVLGAENCQYTQLTSAGTSTVFANPAPQTSPNVLYGVSCALFGTGPAVSCYDVVTPSPGQVAAGTSTQTFQVMQGTYTAVGQIFTPSGGNRGLRLKGNLVVVVTGTLSTWNVLWD